MFKSLLIRWITEINDKMISVGQNGYLAIGIGSFNPTLYGHMQTIMSNVVMPIAYVIFALFCTLELHKVSVRADGSGGGSMLGTEIVFKTMVRFVTCKLAIDNTHLIMRAIYSVSLEITEGVSKILSTQAVSGGLDTVTLAEQINQMGIGDQFGMFVELLIVKFSIFIILGLVQVICVARFIEIYIYIAIAPLPLSMLLSDEEKSIAINFLKSFAAVCLQGVLIYIVLSIFPILLNSNILGDTSIFGMLLYSLILALGVFGSGKLAKTISNAM